MQQTKDIGYFATIATNFAEAVKRHHIEKEKQIMQKQVNVGDVVKADFNGSEADGVVTWVSSCSQVVIFQQQDTGHLYWTDVDNLIEVNTKDNVMLNQEQVFNLGDKVVALTTVGYEVGTVVSVDFYEDEDQFYYEVYFKDLDTSSDYEADELYDLEGLQTKFFVYGAEVVKVVDYLENGYVLTVNDGGAVLLVDEDDLDEDNREYCSGCAGCDCNEDADAKNDSIIEELRDLLQQRSATGIRKYGTTLDRTDLDSSEWCQHLLEELLDAAGYVLRLKKDLEKANGVSIRVNGIA